MLRKLVLVAALAGGLCSALLLGSCGDDSVEPSIPREDAQQLLAELTQVKANVEVQSCTVAASHADSLAAEVQQLPDTVNGDVREGLEKGSKRLQELVSEDCEAPPEPTTTTEETTTEEPTTTTEETTTEEPTTTTEETTTEETTPTTDGSGGNDGGSGGVGL